MIGKFWVGDRSKTRERLTKNLVRKNAKAPGDLIEHRRCNSVLLAGKVIRIGKEAGLDMQHCCAVRRLIEVSYDRSMTRRIDAN